MKTPEVSWNPGEPWLSMRLVKWERGRALLSDRRGDFAAIEGDGVLAWTRDGTAYFTGKPDGDLRRCVVATSACRTIHMPKWRVFAVSPDGKRILAGANEKSHVVDVDSGAHRAVPGEQGAWLDDDRFVYIPWDGSGRTQQLTVYSLRTQKATPLGPLAPVPNLTHLTPSPDGKWVAFVGRKERALDNGARFSRYGVGVFDVAKQTWAHYVDGPEDDKPGFSPGGDSPRWSPDSRRVAFAAGLGIATIDVPTLVSRTVPVEHLWSLLGWVDTHRVAYLRLSRSDDTQVRRYGHGVVDVWCDGHVRDLDGAGDTALTTDGALSQCAASLAPHP